MKKIVGIDLAGVKTRPTGFCKLEGMVAETSILFSDEEIIKKVCETSPVLVAVDAPLSLPPGRKTLEDRTSSHLRESDKELLRRQIKCFPITLGPMRKLTNRGINLKKELKSKSIVTIEVYPGGAQDVLGIPRKQKGIDRLKTGLEKIGISGLKDGLSDHELDAATCAYVGKLFIDGEAVVYGSSKDGIIMPPGDKRTTDKLT
jgi:predicted nuclease with RNAse H fold